VEAGVERTKRRGNVSVDKVFVGLTAISGHLDCLFISSTQFRSAAGFSMAQSLTRRFVTQIPASPQLDVGSGGMPRI
jgi:hypothetical protein